MRTVLLTSVAVSAAALASPALSQTPVPQGPTCVGTPWWTETKSTYEDFDFWVGEWQVYDTASGELRGFDEITKELGGCVISQHWRQMDDNFSPPGSARRLQGQSLTGIDANGQWRQVWTDNGGGNLIFTGGMEGDVMTITSEWYPVPTPNGQAIVRNTWNWRAVSENEIHNWGTVERQGSEAEPQIYFDITYRRSAMGGPAASLRQPEAN